MTRQRWSKPSPIKSDVKRMFKRQRENQIAGTMFWGMEGKQNSNKHKMKRKCKFGIRGKNWRRMGVGGVRGNDE